MHSVSVFGKHLRQIIFQVGIAWCNSPAYNDITE